MTISTDDLNRYNGCSIIDDGTATRLETYDRIYCTSVDGEYWTVEPKFEHRLDMISYKFFGTPLLWWVLALANDISDPFSVEAGISLLIPDDKSVLMLRGVI